MKRVISLVLLAIASIATGPLAVAQSIAENETLAEIPYRLRYQGWITVDATVNGLGPYHFIVDSGATITSAFENLARYQAFTPADREDIRILGLTGAKALPAYNLGTIDFGGARLENHVGVLLPDWLPPNTPPQGVLGLDFLSRYKVHIDANYRLIRLYESGGDARPSSKGWSRTNLKPISISDKAMPLHTVKVQVRGSYIPCIVDLGASGTIFNTAALRAMMAGIRVNMNRSTMSTGSRINDIFENTARVRPIKITRLRLGNAIWRNKIFLVYDAPIFKELGKSSRPFCLLGADLFTDRSIMFDFEDEKLYIGPVRGPTTG
ncbi:aspartyl protease family protein [Hyphococcus sp. DH-69]|uniref:aspartyl protease family protein n=1 Tax=Hyphococcus formosus TaxID=3143534 RepID=UPI00398A695D